MRIAIGGIGHETNTFSSLRTEEEDFFVRRGEEIVSDAVFEEYRSRGVEWVPTLRASAAPHGLVTARAYRALRDELLDRLAATLPVDGVLLTLHGAMEVEEIGDGETDLVRAVRELVGPEVLIAAPFDLHGNVAPAVVEELDILTALRTAPHRDGAETWHRAIGHLIRCLEEGIRPVAAIVKPPLLLPGEFAVTDIEPAKSLYAELRRIEEKPGILDASLFIGCAWTDGPFTSTSVIVVAEEDIALAEREARRLAEAVWETRERFRPEVETCPVDETIDRALAASERPVFLSDSGDNVTAGGAGDIPLIAEKLIERGASEAVVAGIADAEAVARCAEAGIGTRLTLTVGGKLDRTNGRPLEVTGTVRHLEPADAPRLATLRVEGVDLILRSDRRAFAALRAIEEAGIDPMAQKIVVVKLGYLFPNLRENAPRAIMVLSPGFTDLRVEELPYRRVPRPIYPLDRDFDWPPE